jgi:hypothetical protein
MSALAIILSYKNITEIGPEFLMYLDRLNLLKG